MRNGYVLELRNVISQFSSISNTAIFNFEFFLYDLFFYFFGVVLLFYIYLFSSHLSCAIKLFYLADLSSLILNIISSVYDSFSF